MLIEALLIALPFVAGLAVSGESKWRAFGTIVTLETFLMLLAVTLVKQPPLAALTTTVVLATLSFGGGLVFGARRPKFRFGGVAGVALVSGALCTAVASHALEAPLRKETVKTVKWVNASSESSWREVQRVGAVASSRVLGVRAGTMHPPECRLEATGLDSRWCAFEEGRLEQSVLASASPHHLQIALHEEELPRPLFRFTSAAYWFNSQDGKTHIERWTDYESKLAPAWLWRPFERRLVLMEHATALEALSGDFMAIPTANSVAVRLSVKTHPQTRVTVVPMDGSGRTPLILGNTPLDEELGAYVGDTIVLDNEDLGIHYSEVIEYGAPNELKLISKSFKVGSVKQAF